MTTSGSRQRPQPRRGSVLLARLEVCEREAVYGAVFVSNSGDLGVHNSTYANSLLDNSLDYLTNVCHAPA